MKKILLTLLCTSSIAFSQNASKELDTIFDMEQAEAFIAKSNYKGKVITFNEEKHRTTLAKELFKKSQGATVTEDNGFEKTTYKIIEKSTVPQYRVSYILFDGNKIKWPEITDLREKIKASYERGIPFSKLAQRYSMDGNANRGGDTGWFTEGTYSPAFEEKIIQNGYGVNDMFNINIPDENKFYVVVKTHAPEEVNEIKVLKVIESKD